MENRQKIKKIKKREADGRWRDRPFQKNLCHSSNQYYCTRSDTNPQGKFSGKIAEIEGFQRLPDLVIDSNKSAKT